MVSARRGVIIALIIGSIVGGTASATILSAASASQAGREKIETAQREAPTNPTTAASSTGSPDYGAILTIGS
jgi:hypothetical protein